MNNDEKKFPVIEIFGPTIQGEGPLAGTRTNFIRFGGCTYRCEWCDTMYAVDPDEIKHFATKLGVSEIVQAIKQLENPARYVVLSGGDPVMHSLEPLVKALHDAAYKVQVETQAALWSDWLPLCDLVVVSPKPPSAQQMHKFDRILLNNYVEALSARMALKIVVFDEDDFEFAGEIHERYPKIPFYISIGTDQDYSELNQGIQAEMVCARMMQVFSWVAKSPRMNNVKVLPQLHILAWGSKRGV